MHVNAATVRWLRSQVAAVMYEACIHDQSLGGLRVKGLIQEQQETLAAYIAATKWNRWASLAEIHAGAKVLGLNVCAWSDGWHLPTRK